MGGPQQSSVADPEASGCVWCGGRPLTREHLLPQWLSEVLVDLRPAPEGFDSAYESTLAGGVDVARTHPSLRPEMVVKTVCTSCNNGWMADLEGQVQPVLARLVRGEGADVSEAEQVALATWMAKVAVLVEGYARDAVVLGDRDRDAVLAGTAPAGYQVRLAYRDDENAPVFDMLMTTAHVVPAGTPRAEVPDDADANAFAVTMTLGRLVISVAGGAGMDNPARWTLPPRFSLMIWPPTAGGLAWPPAHPRLTSSSEVMAFHEAWWDGVFNPEFPRPNALRLLADDPVAAGSSPISTAQTSTRPDGYRQGQ